MTTRTNTDFTTSFLVDQAPRVVYTAINNVRGWWGMDVEGCTDQLGCEFIYRVKDTHYSRIRVVELVPSQKVVWSVLENHLNYVRDQSEWVGTTISFEIAVAGNQTEVRFAHLGLVPTYECFDVCSNVWRTLMQNSLPSLIATGVGHPY
jgi:hypothetical protein